MKTVDKYNNREIDMMFEEIKEQLTRIEYQTTRTNGRVSNLEGDVGSLKVKLYVVGAVVFTIVVMKFPELVAILKII